MPMQEMLTLAAFLKVRIDCPLITSWAVAEVPPTSHTVIVDAYAVHVSQGMRTMICRSLLASIQVSLPTTQLTTSGGPSPKLSAARAVSSSLFVGRKYIVMSTQEVSMWHVFLFFLKLSSNELSRRATSTWFGISSKKWTSMSHRQKKTWKRILPGTGLYLRHNWARRETGSRKRQAASSLARPYGSWDVLYVAKKKTYILLSHKKKILRRSLRRTPTFCFASSHKI
jgi:hypothetical protein